MHPSLSSMFNLEHELELGRIDAELLGDPVYVEGSKFQVRSSLLPSLARIGAGALMHLPL